MICFHGALDKRAPLFVFSATGKIDLPPIKTSHRTGYRVPALYRTPPFPPCLLRTMATGKKSAKTSCKPRKEQTKVLVLKSVSLHENASHTFSALHAALVPYLMWVNTEQGREQGLEPILLDSRSLAEFSVLAQIINLLRNGFGIPESVRDQQIQFIQENRVLRKNTPLGDLESWVSYDTPLIVRFPEPSIARVHARCYLCKPYCCRHFLTLPLLSSTNSIMPHSW